MIMTGTRYSQKTVGVLCLAATCAVTFGAPRLLHAGTGDARETNITYTVNATKELEKLKVDLEKSTNQIWAGWILFGASYLPALGTGLILRDFDGHDYRAMLAVPAIGPMVAGINLLQDDRISLGLFSIMAAIAQVSGISVAVFGHVYHSQLSDQIDDYLEKNTPQYGSAAAPQWRLSLFPTVDGAGLGVYGTF